MSDRPLAPTFPDKPLRADELHLRKAREPKPVVEPTFRTERAAHVGRPLGVTCNCGSKRVHRIPDPDNAYRSALHCFDCWRKW